MENNLFENIQVNQYQTPLDYNFINTYPDEVQEQLFELITTVPFIKNLISPNRRYAKDMPKDEKGRIIIDFENPHILENMDYFRQPALHYLKHKCYTFLKPNSNPHSEYRKFWAEELRRCWEGYVRESDGEWVTGYMYWFLNYVPMMVNFTKDGQKKAIRKESFPFFFEGIYWRFHYLHNAREQGKHAIELAKRGCAKSYSLATIMSHNLIIGETDEEKTRRTTVLTAYQKEYLKDDKDGTLNKFRPLINFIFKNTPWPNLLLKNSPNEMTWQMGYKDEYDRDCGSLNLTMAVSAKDNPQVLRGKRGWILYEEIGCHIKDTEVLMYDNTIKKVQDVRVGDLLMGKDGTPRKVLELFNGTDMMYKVTLSNGDWHIVNSKHPIYYLKRDWYRKTLTENLSTAPELLQKNRLDGLYIPKANIRYQHKDVLLDPYLLGLWLGDGDSGRLSISNEDSEVLEWLKSNYNGHIIDLKQSEACKVFYIPCQDINYMYLKHYNLLNNKHIPKDYIYNDRDVGLQLLAGLIDTDGNYSEKSHSRCFEITQKDCRKHILDAAKFIATNLGFRCTMTSKISGVNSKKPGTLQYRLRISGNIEQIPTKIQRKKASPVPTNYKQRHNWNDYTFKISEYGMGEYYGFIVDKDHLFVLKDSTVTHNTFKGLRELYDVTRKSVEDGGFTFACQYLVGTTGTKDADFESAKTLLQSPDGYNILSINNVWDKPKQGSQKFGFFFPSYVNRAGCYDKNGNSDVIKALLEILQARYITKYNNADPKSILIQISEDPITPAEAIVKVKAAYFPVAQINERILQIDSNPRFYDKVLIGDLVLNNGKVDFRPSNGEPIRKWGVDNDTPGCIEIYDLPEKDSDGKVPNTRYIGGVDSYDNDQAESCSLYSVFIFDLFTDNIVAEFTGRTDYADDAHEIARKLALLYNARMMFESNKKGWYAYFAKMNSTHLLAETPQYLRDQQMIKYQAFGSNKYGINANAAINAYGNDLLRQWLISPRTAEVEDENGQPFQTTIPTLYTIRNRALLDEAANYDGIHNFDRISAMAQVMLYRQEKIILYQGDMSRTVHDHEDNDYAGNDDFFRQNFDDKFDIKEFPSEGWQ